MPDYIDDAILRKLDALAERYGISPSDFVATLQPNPETGTTSLRLELSRAGNPLEEGRFDKLLRAIKAVPAAAPHTGVLKERPTQILHALDHALTFAPDLRRDSSAM